ncbi:hypothetical protein M7I_6791 [Glarea lozoyensis 74030]|uniref:Uncharacterized protein n=1 Tax=Glarea lozoyensis (strain ATCC 74030 / MF5533) TaxID=1104152 RepID=H0EVJ3_GLAL7|nr:hypothetical protein M7I_6791 [Glarea lozoyensis 74030]
MKGVIESLIHTWLSTPHVEVGERATQMLGDLLEVDCDRRISAGIDTKMSGLQIAGGMAPGQGLLWRHLFVELLVVMSTTELTQTTMKYLANLVNTVAGADKTLYKSLESIARNPESPPELVDLLVKLSE